MPVEAVFDNLAAGANIDDILTWHEGLDPEQLRAVIAFAGRSIAPPPKTPALA